MAASQMKCVAVGVVTNKQHFKASSANGDRAAREESYVLNVAWLGGGTRYYCDSKAEWDQYEVGHEVRLTAEPFAEGDIRYREVDLQPAAAAAPPAGVRRAA